MRRRTFLQSLGAAPAVALIQPVVAAAQEPQSPAPKPEGLPMSSISGITGTISAVTYHGTHIAATVPTLAQGTPATDVDLKSMAGKAMNYLIHNPRKALDWEPVFQIKPLACPPAPHGHDPIVPGDTDCRMDWEYIYMREMSGSRDGLEVESGVRKRILDYVRSDGLAWVPPGHYMEGEVYAGATPEGEIASSWATAKIIRSLSETYVRTGDRTALDKARQMFVGLTKLAEWKQGRAIYEGGSGGWRDGKWVKHQHPVAAIEPLVRYWEVSGDDEALQFAIAVTEGLIETAPALKIEPSGKFDGHMHSTLHGVWGVAHLGVAINQPRYLEWAKRVYDYATTQGIGTGWLAAATWNNEVRLLSEMCATSDLVSIASLLGQGGYPEYWDHLERYVRNMIVPSQFSMTPEYVALYRKTNAAKGKREVEQGLKRMRDFEGGFVAAPAPNSWVNWMPPTPQSNGERMQMFGCCAPEGMRALHTAWSTVTMRKGAETFVHTSLDRNSEHAKVVSFLPAQPRLTVIAKQAGDYLLRIPSWSDRDAVSVFRNGNRVALKWSGPALAYARFGQASAGEELTVCYPLAQFRQNVDFAFAGRPDLKFELDWSGNRVVGISPGARQLPMPGYTSTV
ncbi:MAG: hypothetical protein SGJ11_01955 [Phycisphaerae bacterium]|nr:hypothetical protein [Phycisphaerae bacterium]